MSLHYPYIRFCMASSLDGKISAVDGTGAIFSSKADKVRFFTLRAKSDALITGVTSAVAKGNNMRVTSTIAKKISVPLENFSFFRLDRANREY